MIKVIKNKKNVNFNYYYFLNFLLYVQNSLLMLNTHKIKFAFKRSNLQKSNINYCNFSFADWYHNIQKYFHAYFLYFELKLSQKIAQFRYRIFILKIIKKQHCTDFTKQNTNKAMLKWNIDKQFKYAKFNLFSLKSLQIQWSEVS